MSDRHPPDLVLALADACVQCGLCLPHCPTYALTGDESESPRGRIAIARALADGRLTAEPSADAALDHCLGCRRCEAVCPAHVAFAPLLLETRRRQRQRRGTSLRQHTLEWLCAHPTLLNRLLRLPGVRLPGVRSCLLPRAKTRPTTTRGGTPAIRGKRQDLTPPLEPIAIFSGCIARAFDDELALALDRLLITVGFAPRRPARQTCCGTLHLHAGNVAQAASLAKANARAFAGCSTVLSTASGCHAALADALAPEQRLRDALDVLAEHADRLCFRTAAGPVALHLPCSQQTVVGSEAALRRLLARIPELHLIELPGMGCCGAAGTHMLEQPARAAALRAPLLRAARAGGARIMVSANIGCRLHLAAGSDIEVVHPIVFLARHLS
ncbi:MAG: (Fe-S)-binding protein [Gammaproteobacteria bacterium HGW-Gammaproteobacteria-4]|jgi:glycolate oxidase iron-sulfur subunit|nr:MAG: (Fe-S)-binding protein [Gammaproteobacteria bacterium HGW-Gammaproteobacteria-4]